ncbi:SpoIIE family protein phosphatase [Rhizomonospora bruguierae]|uniref:SpoIIE family protein phosphatase n=1 Tax=Rhizomonospora bruguierae TaxID=1581705 RepID=UPI001BCE7822|nr:SpoIIE family protein phosphatase [Micromonospora sp. NBRC 107566]
MPRRRSALVSALASLLPLAPAAYEAWHPLEPGVGSVPLLGTVLLACLIGGLGAGIVATLLSGALFHLVLLEPRFATRVNPEELPALATFGLAALSVLLAYGWLAHVTRRTERAWLAAEYRVGAEERLRRELDRSLAQLSAVLESSPHGFALLDTGLTFRGANEVLARVCGLTGRPAPGDAAEAHGPLAGLTLADLATVLRTGRPVVDRPGQGVDADGVVRHLLASCFPVRLPDGEVTGVAVQVIDETQRRTLAELEAEAVRLRETAELERAAREASQRAEQARAALVAEHKALQMFQRTMLPRQIPTVPGIDLATAYLPVTDRVDVGGDWYDAFLLPDDRLVLAVGDVTGHDLRAASIMGQVRNAVRAYAVEDPLPGSVLCRVNRLLAGLPDLDLVTMLFGVYDLSTHTLVWSRAGHPGPVHRRGDEITILDEPGGTLLGALPGAAPYEEGKLLLEPGDTVLWYTDGLTDRRDVDPEAGRARLRGAVRSCPPGTTAAELVKMVPRGLRPPGGPDDDICLLALRRLPPD